MAETPDPSSDFRSGSVSTVPSSTGVALAPLQMEPFDEYVLVGKLGHGGMAEVFLALAQGPSGFRKLYVVKRLHGHYKDDRQLVEMFLDEARLAARLSHPHVVQTYKVGSHAGHHFLAMEYLDGQPMNRLLKRCVDRQETVPLTLAARILSDALDGLDYAHNAADFDGTPLGIVHRDISPHNIFLTYEGQVKILDFGIAKAVTQESNTRVGTIKGKFAYIAPEQARGEAVDPRADLWSMGVTMWELLAGRRLFRGATEVAVLQASLSEPVPPLSSVRPDVARELVEICERALQRDPSLRWPSAKSMKAELDEWISAGSKSASRVTLSAYLRDKFAGEIEGQRARLKSCLEQVQQAGLTGPSSSISTLTSTASSSEPRSGVASVRTTPSGPAPSTASIAPTSEALPTASSAPLTGAPDEPSSTRRGALIVGGIALLAVLGGLIALATTRGGGGAGPAAPAAEVVDVAAREPPAPLPPPSAPLPAAFPPPLPSEPATLEAPAAGSERAGAEERPDRRRPPVRRGPSEPAVVAPTPAAEAPAPPPPVEGPAPAPGRLQLDCTPYAVVSIAGRRLGITPIDVELPAGAHTLTLRNPEAGIETTYRVTVRAGETTSRTVALE
jgi:serine/threonine protein kinase